MHICHDSLSMPSAILAIGRICQERERSKNCMRTRVDTMKKQLTSEHCRKTVKSEIANVSLTIELEMNLLSIPCMILQFWQFHFRSSAKMKDKFVVVVEFLSKTKTLFVSSSFHRLPSVIYVHLASYLLLLCSSNFLPSRMEFNFSTFRSFSINSSQQIKYVEILSRLTFDSQYT